MLAWKNIPVFDPISKERRPVFGAMNSGHVYIIATTESCMELVLYLLIAEVFLRLRSIFKSVVFKDSDYCNILTYNA